MHQCSVAVQSKKTTPEQLLIKTAETVISSKHNRANVYLKKLKQNKTIFSYNQNPNFDSDFVAVVDLSMHSKLHSDYNYLDCVINFAYPLFKNQYAVYRHNNVVLGYLSWAWFSPTTEEYFYNNEKVIVDPDIVCSGTQGWIVDVIAPYGNVRQTVNHATEVARVQGVDSAKFKFQRNYLQKRSRRNFWSHR